jgi:hypothetical protein
MLLEQLTEVLLVGAVGFIALFRTRRFYCTLYRDGHQDSVQGFKN